jgi:hypothetical protein
MSAVKRTDPTTSREATEQLNASDVEMVEVGQVYIDITGRGHDAGRRMVVESLTTGLPGDTALYAVIRAEDGHPSRTGVVAVARLLGRGYRQVAS